MLGAPCGAPFPEVFSSFGEVRMFAACAARMLYLRVPWLFPESPLPSCKAPRAVPGETMELRKE